MNKGVHNKQRATAGNGKSAYGITPEKIAQLTAIRADKPSDAQNFLKSLYEFTTIYLAHAYDLAQADKKDDARAWCRFFENSRILDLLKISDAPLDVVAAQKSLRTLKLACHPMEVPSYATDLQAIRACLNQILSHVTKKTDFNQQSSSRGSVRRCDGHDRVRQKDFVRGPGLALPSGPAAPPSLGSFSFQAAASPFPSGKAPARNSTETQNK